ncbi:MAG TPA: dodecin family protein [Planctomycetota bacterium]|nr:dodecin family protein [Planctomycetota bacterium]
MVFKIIEVLGTSDKSWDDAVKQAFEIAKHTLKHIHSIDVVKHTARVENDQIVSYTADCKVCFEVRPEEHHHHHQ